MKKRGILIILLLVLNISFVLAENTTAEKIDEGFICLENRANDCSNTNAHETAAIIMAGPDGIFEECVDRLEDLEANNNWGSIKDTALAVIALDHAGRDTEPNIEWLKGRTRNADDLIWYLQQDSNVATECSIAYDGNDYTINVDSNKKLDKSAGSCLARSQSNFWLRIDEDCYGEEFEISCDKDFITTLLYRNQNSETIYVLEGTSGAPAFGTTTEKIDSKCFGDSGGCDYEGTVWAAEAFLRTGETVSEFIPYIIAQSDANEEYLPEAFAYMITNYDDYANTLIKEQRTGNYWEARGSEYGKFYDTSLALLALGSSTADSVTNAKNWLLFQQGSNGCWDDSTLDTAMVLWALEGRPPRSSGDSGGGSVTSCEPAGFFCTPRSDCPLGETLNNYHCPSLSTVCCETENLQMCEDAGGEVCEDNEFCNGNEINSLDSNSCCTGTCEEKRTLTECEENFYTCQNSCGSDQEDAGYSCGDGGQICCRTVSASGNQDSGGVPWWIWALAVLIVGALAAIAYVKREELAEFFKNLKDKMSKGKGDSEGSSPRGPRSPPGPGSPPMMRRPGQVGPPQAGMPMRRPPQRRTRDPEMQRTFAKLHQMSR